MVSIKVIQGYGEIGGNCIRIDDKDISILFDQGMRFPVFNRYYSQRVQPKGIPELRQLGVIPPVEAYQDIATIYISHFHLDHLGLLAGIPVRTTVNLPSIELFHVIERWYRLSPNWFAYIPPRYTTALQEVTPLKEEENNVMAIPVEHSSYPAYAYLYFGSDATVLYTGDLRITSILDRELHKRLYPTTLLTFLNEENIHIDYLILEGTNLGSPLTPLTGKCLNDALSNLLEQEKPIVVAVHNQEIENILLVAKKAVEKGKELVVVSNRLADLLDFWKNRLEMLNTLKINVLSSIVETPHMNLEILDEISLEEKLNEYILIADLWHIIDLLRTLDPYRIPPGSPAIMLTSEPRQEEAVYSESLALRWLRQLNLQPYRLRISGHYYPYQLKTLIKTIKPKNIIPVHTENPELLYTQTNLYLKKST